MSTEGDNHSNVTPDVVESHNSSPSSGRGRGGGRSPHSSRQSRTEPINQISASRGRGKSHGRTGGRGRISSKDGTSDRQPMTLMRTHSAPPDEHAGNFELGGNGVRATTNSLFSSRPLQTTEISETLKPHTSTPEMSSGPPRSIGNGSLNSLPEEKQFEEKHPESPNSDRSPVTLAQPIQFGSYYLDVQRGYPQPPIAHQLLPTFPPQPRLLTPRVDNGERSKIPPVMPVQLPPRMSPSPMIPQYFNLSPPLQMMPHQARPLGSIPIQAPIYQPQMMYTVFPGYQPTFPLAPGVSLNRNAGVMPSPGIDPSRPVLLDPRQNGSIYNYPGSNISYSIPPEQQFSQNTQRLSSVPSEPSKKRSLVLKDKSGKVIVPKDLLESQARTHPDYSQPSVSTSSIVEKASEQKDHIMLSHESSGSELHPLEGGLPQDVVNATVSSTEINRESDEAEVRFHSHPDQLMVPNQTDEVCDLLLPPASEGIPESNDEIGSDDDWEAQASKLSEDTPALSSQPLRSLRPGGGEAITHQSDDTNTVVFGYSKPDILALRPAFGTIERPPQCQSYEKLIIFGQDNQQIPRTQLRPQHSMSPKLQGHPEKWKSPNSTYSPSQTFQNPNEPSQSHKRNPSSRGAKKAPPPPMPKKVISDPLELMNREVMVLLNKITPQTFLKLTGKLSEIQIQNSLMMEKLVRLIFEKAVSEPSFANLYAEMCSILDSSNNYTNFCHIVWNRDTNQYLWLKDIQYSNILAGPYPSVVECIDACLSRVAPPTKLITHPVSIAEELIVNNNLISVFKTADIEEYFGTFIPYGEIDKSCISDTYFASQDAAAKSLLKKFGFNKMLVKICQDEYLDSIENRGYYGSPSLRRAKLETLNLSQEEMNIELAEIEELEGNVKRRMMGNIRFIGELCKKSIIKTTTMHECIHELLFSKSIDEQELELVCKLLRTVGEKMEQNLNDEQSRAFDSYFAKLHELSKDTKFNIRIRFFVEDIINLRENHWQERRVADGPALIEEIRNKAANEELSRKQAPLKRGKPPGARITPTDARNRIISDKGNQRHPSFPSASPELRPLSNSNDSPASVKTPVEIQEKAHLSNEAIKRRVKSIVEEYLNLKDPSEACECLGELPDPACGELVNVIISKYLDCGKPDIQRDLISLLRAVMSQLSAARECVEDSVSKCEPLLFIVDSMTDVKQAPELLGTIIAELLNGQACRKQIIDNTLDQIRKQNLSDEFGISDDEVVSIQNRLLSALSCG